MDDRKTLTSTGEHLGALRRLAADYTAAEYLAAVEAARDAGDGERYADKVLGVDADSVLRGVEQENGDVILAIEANLRRRGIAPAAATYEEYRAALIEAAS